MNKTVIQEVIVSGGVAHVTEFNDDGTVAAVYTLDPAPFIIEESEEDE